MMAEALFKVGDTLEGDTIIYDEFYEDIPSVCRLTMTRELFDVIHTLHQVAVRYNMKSVSRYTFDMPPLNHEWLDAVDEDATVFKLSGVRIEAEEFRVSKYGDFQIIGWQKHSDTRFMSPHWGLNHE